MRLPSFPASSILAALGPLVALGAFAACGEVIVPETTGAGGSATTSSSSSSTSSASSSSGGEVGCELGSNDCEVGFCHFPDELCGMGVPGVCSPAPSGCAEDCPGVCGCDGKVYCNACQAAMAGTDATSDIGCYKKDIYSATILIADLDHMVVRKANWPKDVCVQIFLDAPMDNVMGFDFTAPQSFGVVNAQVSGSAADCMPNAPPLSFSYGAVGGSGVLEWTAPPGMSYPCFITINATLDFPPGGPTWAEPVETFSAADVPLEGGCF